jgi:predicted nuclease with RNAse H fold
MTLAAFAGIDVAFAKGKRLPIVVCVREGSRLVPLLLRDFREALPPRGRGNRIALDPKAVNVFALEALEYLRAVEKAYDLRLQRIAIDAPSCYKREGIVRRAAEVAMDKQRISCFATPNRKQFDEIKNKVRLHLDSGLPENRMPHANQLWMLVGFALFEVLKEYYDCIEVFPQAIANALQAGKVHKSKSEGISRQLTAVANHSGWPLDQERMGLSKIAFGSMHDKLDAYLSAWVASLSSEDCFACGVEPSDVIWLPRLDTTNRTSAF